MEITERLKELAHAAADQQWREFSMRVPAEPDRDADLVLMRAAMLIEEMRPEVARYNWLRENISDDMQWYLLGTHGMGADDLDGAIDAAMLKPQN